MHTDAFKKYKKATGADEDDDTGFLKISNSDFKKLKSLYFTIGGVSWIYARLLATQT